MKQKKGQTVIEHLEELRKRLIIVAVTFTISIAIGFWFAPNILNILKQQPTALGVDWNLFGYTDGIMIYLKCAFILALLITLPVALLQIWLFVKPGLTEQEAKNTIVFVPVSFLLFLIGLSFSYFILFPLMLNFLSSINLSIGATETYGINQYFSLLFNLTIPVGVVFELPVVILFLTRLGIVTPTNLRKMRKVAYFILIVVGVSISPPDFISDFLIIIPLLLLFEISIWVSSWSLKRQHAKDISNEILNNNG
ncbi:Sec-independent protein translocase protein TatC OS=Ureibacillus acetophenoni OX=614649 GN=tatC PE=3 SV=1 [Ureibacillus acetophenoni]